jgi:hypothetical protein
MSDSLPSDKQLSTIHAICQLIRENTWAGIDETKALCHKCPQTIQSPYGPGTQGCFLLATEVYDLARQPDSAGASGE